MPHVHVSYVRPQGLLLYQQSTAVSRKPFINKWSALWCSLSHCLYLWLTRHLSASVYLSISSQFSASGFSGRANFAVVQTEKHAKIKRNPNDRRCLDKLHFSDECEWFERATFLNTSARDWCFIHWDVNLGVNSATYIPGGRSSLILLFTFNFCVAILAHQKSVFSALVGQWQMFGNDAAQDSVVRDKHFAFDEKLSL